MSTICFVTYEIFPTTQGGCGVLLHHAAEMLLATGHEVIFLLDIPKNEFDRFVDIDRLSLPNPGSCRAYHVDSLCGDFQWGYDEVQNVFLIKSLRFSHALDKVCQQEKMDYIEFIEYCGIGYYALVKKLFKGNSVETVLGSRLHNSIELIDLFEATKVVDRERYLMYSLERAALDFSEAVLTPSLEYYNSYYKDNYHLVEDKVIVSQSPKKSFQPVIRRPADPPYKIMYFGRIYQFKGVDNFIKAAILMLKQRPKLDVSFYLVGPDSFDSPIGNGHTAYLKTLIPKELQGRFHFTGHLTHEVVADLLNDVLFAVFPNLFESFCYALHEIYDAGVPVIINNLPAFKDFFKNGENALVYDGTTEGLVRAMERMLDDGAARDKLSRPYPVADKPLGDFYDNPRPLAPLQDGGSTDTIYPLVVVLSENDESKDDLTRKALMEQKTKNFQVVWMGEKTGLKESGILFLGKIWYARDFEGTEIPPMELRSRDALLLLESGDILHPEWMQLCTKALRNRATIAFTGTWSRENRRVSPGTIDLAPEAYPFWFHSRITRTLMRTEQGVLLTDLFDQNLGSYGEIGYLWNAVDRWGRGCLLPEPLLEIPFPKEVGNEPKRLANLIARWSGQERSKRLAILSGVLHHEHCMKDFSEGKSSSPIDPLEMAEKHIGGKLLLTLAMKKVLAKMENTFKVRFKRNS